MTGEKRSGRTDLLTEGQCGEEGSSEWEGSGRGKIACRCVHTHVDTDLPKPSEEASASLLAPVCVACLPAPCGTATQQHGSAASHPIWERASPVLSKWISIYNFTWEGASTVGEHCITCAISSEHATLLMSLHKEHDLVLHLFHICSFCKRVCRRMQTDFKATSLFSLQKGKTIRKPLYSLHLKGQVPLHQILLFQQIFVGGDFLSACLPIPARVSSKPQYIESTLISINYYL